MIIPRWTVKPTLVTVGAMTQPSAGSVTIESEEGVGVRQDDFRCLNEGEIGANLSERVAVTENGPPELILCCSYCGIVIDELIGPRSSKAMTIVSMTAEGDSAYPSSRVLNTKH